MSGRKAKARRRTQHELPLHLVNADYVKRSADAVLGVDPSTVPLTTVSQFAVGWMRAAFEQSRVIADLTASGMAQRAAPNRRLFWELALRLLWLSDIPHSDRAGVADTMLALGRSTETTTNKHMQDMGLESDIDVAEMEKVVLSETDDARLRQQAKNLTAAAKSTSTNSAAIYRLWREDSTWAHATGFLAGHYAPAGDQTIRDGLPPAVDGDLEAHRLVTSLIVLTAGYLLTEEGVPSDIATAPFVAFHSVG